MTRCYFLKIHRHIYAIPNSEVIYLFALCLLDFSVQSLPKVRFEPGFNTNLQQIICKSLLKACNVSDFTVIFPGKVCFPANWNRLKDTLFDMIMQAWGTENFHTQKVRESTHNIVTLTAAFRKKPTDFTLSHINHLRNRCCKLSALWEQTCGN